MQAIEQDVGRNRVLLHVIAQHQEFGGQHCAQCAQRLLITADCSQSCGIIERRNIHIAQPWPQNFTEPCERHGFFDAGGKPGCMQARSCRIGDLGAGCDRGRDDAAFAQRCEQVHAAAAGHVAVEQEQVEAVFRRGSQCFGQTRCTDGGATQLLQRAAQKVQRNRIVVGNQDSQHDASIARGKRSVNVGGWYHSRMTSLETDITGLTHDGRGVAHVNGKAVFVSGALAGERVRMRFTGKHRHYDEAAVEEVLSASPDRVLPRCAHFGVCGGCALQHLAPAAQIAAKQRVLLENLERIGKVSPREVLPALTASPWGYRRKGRLSVKFVEKKGRVLVGFRESNGRYVADINSCDVLHPAVGTRITEISALIETLDAKRDIPQIEIAAGDDLVALVFRHLQPLSARDVAALTAFAQGTQLAIFLQPGGIDSVAPLWPTDTQLSFRLPKFDVELDFRPLDFIQVNSMLNRSMIDHALALLDPQPTDRVLDLFCGLGNFTLPLARRAAQVTGVEGEVGLVRRAGENAQRNGLANAQFFAADLAADQRDAPWAKADYELLLLDPPRSGAEALLEYLPRKSARRIVYVSCHPASLARDAGVLVNRHGFALTHAGVMDMFPHTAHVESIAAFQR